MRVPERRLPNGVRLHWREAGDPTKLPIVWIHGGSVEDSSFMVPDLEPFFGRLRALFPDTRGHGQSSTFERVEDYGYPQKAEDVLLWLDALGIERAVWGGASMGGALSLWAAIHAPTRVRAVISISGPPYEPLAEDKAWWRAHRPLIETGRVADYFDANVRLRMGEAALARFKARPERYVETIERLRGHSTASLLALLDETYSRHDWLADCARIRCPVLVIAGQRGSLSDGRHVRAGGGDHPPCAAAGHRGRRTLSEPHAPPGSPVGDCRIPRRDRRMAPIEM
jgi:3-oxoadipate enol-lactonase